MNRDGRSLLAVVEQGGYPNFNPLYERGGFRVTVVGSVRRALAAIRKDPPDVVVAEFNFQSQFRDRSSNLETLMAVLQKRPAIRLIVFYDHEFAAPFERFRHRHAVYGALPFPIDEQALSALLATR